MSYVYVQGNPTICEASKWFILGGLVGLMEGLWFDPIFLHSPRASSCILQMKELHDAEPAAHVHV